MPNIEDEERVAETSMLYKQLLEKDGYLSDSASKAASLAYLRPLGCGAWPGPLRNLAVPRLRLDMLLSCW